MCAQPSAIMYISVMDLMMTTWLVETCCLFDTFMIINRILLCWRIIFYIFYSTPWCLLKSWNNLYCVCETEGRVARFFSAFRRRKPSSAPSVGTEGCVSRESKFVTGFDLTLLEIMVMYVKVIKCSREFSVRSYEWEHSTFFHRKLFFVSFYQRLTWEFRLWRLTPCQSSLVERWCFTNIRHLIICWVCTVVYLFLLLVLVNKDFFLGHNWFSSNFTPYFNIFVTFTVGISSLSHINT